MMSFRDSIKDDHLVFDNTFDGIVTHNQKIAQPDFTTGKMRMNAVDVPVFGCLYRDLATRNNQSIKQVHQSSVALQNDVFYTSDFVVEIPKIDGLVIDEGDKFKDLDTNKTFNIVAVDITTLTTRFRVALREFK
jgi:hypothetical protein